MIRVQTALTALALSAAPLASAAQDAPDFSATSEARSWNLYAEQPARFEATVVDPLCEIAGDCAEGCGGGARQLALLRAADGALVLPTKNGQPAFTGAVRELLPFCGAVVEVDGLLIEDDYVGATNVYLVQRIREVGAEGWVTADAWTRDWADRNAGAAGDGPWFRRDPGVSAEIAQDGYLGIGLPHREAWDATR
jgi:hypothetical protein